MQTTTTILLVLFGVGALPTPLDADGAAVRPHVKHCLVSLIEDVEVPAQERGVLISVPAGEGDQVKRDDLLAQIDDSQARLQKTAAETKLRAAVAQAEDDTDVLYAEAAHKVAETEYRQAVELNRRIRGTIPESEVRRLELMRNRAQMQISKARTEMAVAKMNAQVHQAEVRAADDIIRRQQIRSPVDGAVVAVFRHAGEWVNPGDTVLRVVRMDRLRVEGFLDAAEHNPSEIANRPVTVAVKLARGREVVFTGRIVFVSPLVQAGGKYRIRAEVENRAEKGHWLLCPGATAEMSIGE